MAIIKHFFHIFQLGKIKMTEVYKSNFFYSTIIRATKKTKKGDGASEKGYPQSIYVKIAGMNYRFSVDSSVEKAKTMYTAKIANDLLNETLEENPLIPTNQALILAYMEACFRWQNLLHGGEEEKKPAPLLPLEQYCKENNIPMEEL